MASFPRQIINTPLCADPDTSSLSQLIIWFIQTQTTLFIPTHADSSHICSYTFTFTHITLSSHSITITKILCPILVKHTQSHTVDVWDYGAYLSGFMFCSSERKRNDIVCICIRISLHMKWVWPKLDICLWTFSSMKIMEVVYEVLALLHYLSYIRPFHNSS